MSVRIDREEIDHATHLSRQQSRYCRRDADFDRQLKQHSSEAPRQRHLIGIGGIFEFLGLRLQVIEYQIQAPEGCFQNQVGRLFFRHRGFRHRATEAGPQRSQTERYIDAAFYLSRDELVAGQLEGIPHQPDLVDLGYNRCPRSG